MRIRIGVLKTPWMACAALIALSSCTRPTSVPSDTVVVALSAEPATLDPRRATDAVGTRVAGLLYSSLVRTGQDLRPEGEAAEKWTITGNTIEFTLRPGLQFSDGHPVAAEDISTSFANAMDPAKSPFASSFSVIEKVEVGPPSQPTFVRLKLREPSATLLSDLNVLKILPAKSSAEIPIGSGPFTLESASSNEIRLKARKQHAYATPKIEKVIFKIIRDDQTRVSKMIKGELDLAQADFPPSKIAELQKEKSLRIHQAPGLAMTYLLMNLNHPDLQKPELRKAMAHAIDRNSIVKHQLSGLATLATSLLTPINPYFEKTLEAPAYDLVKSKEIISKLKLRPLVLKTSNNPAAVDNGRLIASGLVKAGLQVTTQSYEWGTFYSDVVGGRFDLAVMRWVGTVDPDLYRKAFHSKELPPVGRNRGNYKNAKLDRLLDEGAKTMDPEKRTAIYREVQKIVMEELPIIPLWYDTDVAVTHERLKNYVQPRDGSYWPLTFVEKE